MFSAIVCCLSVLPIYNILKNIMANMNVGMIGDHTMLDNAGFTVAW
jgi:hypothetical protein